ncbi:MAG TPA: 6-hydroxynicotinate reductase [Deltaproteobacteria bacterium]|nr:6-hydroxynicotinate reductase [Deltaproteobacteria bacterium]
MNNSEQKNTTAEKVICDACPILCRISPGKTGSCDRYGNVDGKLKRMDPIILTQKAVDQNQALVPFGEQTQKWDGSFLAPDVTVNPESIFPTAVGAGTTYPDYKPAPFIIASKHHDVDMVTVVTEGIFSYCSYKIKIDTDRYVGPEQASVRCQGEAVGHVMTAEYGSQMLSLGGVHHLTGGSKQEGRVTCQMMMDLGNKTAVELEVDEGSKLVVQAGVAPIIDGNQEERMRVGCGSATIGIFAQQWFGHVDEVIVVDEHITGMLSEHQAGRFLGMEPSGIRVRGRRSTPGRYFQVANPGHGWGGTDVSDPLEIIDRIKTDVAYPGLRLLMVSTTGEDAAYFVLDEDLKPCAQNIPEVVQKVVDRIGENCEPALSSVLFMAGAGGSLRAGVTENPVRLTRSVRSLLTRTTCGGAPAYVWPGGGITVMVDVTKMPENSFGSVPTPAIVAPIEFTMKLKDYELLGGHMAQVRRLEDMTQDREARISNWNEDNPWPFA